MRFSVQESKTTILLPKLKQLSVLDWLEPARKLELQAMKRPDAKSSIPWLDSAVLKSAGGSIRFATECFFKGCCISCCAQPF